MLDAKISFWKKFDDEESLGKKDAKAGGEDLHVGQS